jgi:hypothetical protein
MKPPQTLPPTAPTSRRALSRPRLAWGLAVAWLAVGLCGLAGTARRVLAADDAAAIERRLADSARYLASDELEGRGPGTKGIDLAADYIARQFTQFGLKTDLFYGTPMQRFPLSTSPEIGPNNKLTLVGPPGSNGNRLETIELKLSEDFMPMIAGGTGKFDLPLVFVGYGITAPAEGYDDYAGVDVVGKAVIVLRHEPQQADPQSVFNGTKPSAYAPFHRKLSNACQHGAAAVIFCNDQFKIRQNVEGRRRQWQQALDRLADQNAKFKQVDNPSFQQIETQRARIDELLRQVQSSGERLRAEYDPVLPPRAAGGGDSGCDVPVVSCRRAVLDQAVKAALATELAVLEEQIDQGPRPHSHELTGWRVAGRTDVQRQQSDAKNVVAVLEGEGPLAEETIVLGAHYDHLGRRPAGSMFSRIVRSLFSAEPQEGVIYSGADDNASGVAALIEIARTLANRPEKLHRSVVFVAFSGEERGLLGSAYYVSHPPIALEQTVAMLNLDMVGRLRDQRLIVFGSGTATGFGDLLDRIYPRYDLKLEKSPTGFGGSDHLSFQAKKIPAMHFFTGAHENLHRPSDDFETLNIAGMRRVSCFVAEVVVALANAENRPEYVAAAGPRRRPGSPRPYLGTVPDFAAEGPGYALSSVVEGGPAQRAGLASGDIIVQFGDSQIGNLEDIERALRKHKAGDRVQVVVHRGKESLTFEVTLDPPR